MGRVYIMCCLYICLVCKLSTTRSRMNNDPHISFCVLPLVRTFTVGLLSYCPDRLPLILTITHSRLAHRSALETETRGRNVPEHQNTVWLCRATGFITYGKNSLRYGRYITTALGWTVMRSHKSPSHGWNAERRCHWERRCRCNNNCFPVVYKMSSGTIPRMSKLCTRRKIFMSWPRCQQCEGLLLCSVPSY